MRRLLLFALLFISCVYIGIMITSAGRYRDVYRSVCDLAESKFYKADQKFVRWILECRKKSASVRSNISSEQLLAEIQDHMNELQVSHFQVYDPGEDKRLWHGESVDTGIRARYIEDSLVIYKIEQKSAAALAGVWVGDEILAMSGTDQVTPWGASRRTGTFKLRRQGKEFEVEIKAKDLRVDSSPRLRALDRSTALLELDSFRAEFFEKKSWIAMAKRLMPYAHVIVDVRENAGGNFVAMLRALSTFHCGGKDVGAILQPRKALPVKASYDDNPSDAHQISELEKYRELHLRTFDGYGCYPGEVTVLIGPNTASVSEIFAHSFLARPRGRVWGLPTAGDVILAVWYDLPGLGRGFSVSIPEAVYMTPQRTELENAGVNPQRELHYDLKLALRGIDSWIESARKN